MKSRHTLCAVAAIAFSARAAQAAFVPVYACPQASATFDNTSYSRGFVNNAGTSIALIQGNGVRWSAGSSELLGNLGTQSGFATVKPRWINSAGAVAGFAQKWTAPGEFLGERAVRWNAGSTAAIELANLGLSAQGTTNAEATALNDAGTVVGWAQKYSATVSQGQRAVRWNPDGTFDELQVPGNTGPVVYPLPTAINATGMIGGYVQSTTQGGQNVGSLPVRWAPGGTAVTVLQSLGTDNHPGAINGGGTVVGYAQAGNTISAARWAGGGTTGELLGLGSASDINDAGVVVGQSNNAPVRWDPTGTDPIALGFLPGFTSGAAVDINGSGEIVGAESQSTPTGLLVHATMWTPAGAVVDLNDLVDPASGWVLDHATTISDTGWIAGVGKFDPDGPGGQSPSARNFLMQVPEPASMIFCVSGLLLIRRRRTSLLARVTQTDLGDALPSGKKNGT